MASDHHQTEIRCGKNERVKPRKDDTELGESPRVYRHEIANDVQQPPCSQRSITWQLNYSNWAAAVRIRSTSVCSIPSGRNKLAKLVWRQLRGFRNAIELSVALIQTDFKFLVK